MKSMMAAQVAAIRFLPQEMDLAPIRLAWS
jgi:hypothetical protein